MSTPVKTTEVSRPRSSQHVSVSWNDDAQDIDAMDTSQSHNPTTDHGSRLQFEIAECVETKTITTTTTTKRAYPPVYVRERRPLKSLDSKEYPLAGKPTPPELAKFSFDVDYESEHEREQHRLRLRDRARDSTHDRFRDSIRSDAELWTSFDSAKSQPSFDYSQEDAASASASTSPFYRQQRRVRISGGPDDSRIKSEPGVDNSPSCEASPQQPPTSSFRLPHSQSHSQSHPQLHSQQSIHSLQSFQSQASDSTVTRRSTRSNSVAGSPVSSINRKVLRSASHTNTGGPSTAMSAAADRPRRAASGYVRDDRDTHSYLATPDNSHNNSAVSAFGGGRSSLRHRTLRSERASAAATAATSAVSPIDKSESETGNGSGAAQASGSGAGLATALPLFETGSPTGSDSHTVFSSTVATPPIIDADADTFADPDESLQQTVRALPPRVLGNVGVLDASLPSPRLSPTLSAVHPSSNVNDDDTDDLDEPAFSQQALVHHSHDSWMESQSTEDGDASIFGTRGRNNPFSNQLVNSASAAALAASAAGGSSSNDGDFAKPNALEVQSMLERFDVMPNEMKTFMIYQFLRRCSRKTLHTVASVVNPALKCDFFKQLPLELSLEILSYLDFRDLCRAAQVSKHWRNIIDSNETGWKELFDQDGFEMPLGELQKAIAQGWGWQDPVGVEGCELDLSLRTRLDLSEHDLRAHKTEPSHASAASGSGPSAPTTRSSRAAAKRKRAITSYPGSERSKRRPSAQDAPSKEDKKSQWPQQHKSEGPISAASAAAAAVPNPQIGIPCLRNLHLFKSLYRRHHMIRQSWTSGKVKPAHVAFTAHPRHVITCLQFDDDKIITGSDDTLIHIYDTKTGRLMKKLEGHEGGVWALQYEGNVLVSGSTDRSVRVWDIEKGLCTQVFYGHTSTVRCLQILMPTAVPGKFEDGRQVMMPPKPLIITGSRDNQLRVWRLPEPGSRRYIQTGPPANDSECPYFIRILAGHTSSVRSIAAHGDTLVSGSYDTTVRVWRISTGEALHVLHGHLQRVYSVVLDTKRNRCISGSMDSNVKIWDLETGACLYTLEGHALLVGLLDLRDEKLVSAAADSTLRVWDPETGTCKNMLSAHTGAITCFQHDGRKVISGSEKTVKMWDIQTGECISDLLSDLSGVWQVKFDGRRCVAAVQRDNLTYVEILDFGAVRDGVPVEELGKRRLLNGPESESGVEEEQ
ncbi:cell division control protein [Ophiostoma piceae UAMH 11346]|uniref:Cell division control protein n=1 Tax=Ophiostoma piceae (strain UAMH 11346) TaxID=1262450 RepID=S3BSQ4_OPHP1|nr:cell division control protein [Ophiostoma piceae UAMH 11346]